MGTTLTSITHDELRAALDAGNVTVVDGQPPAAYGLRHLPGALNVAAEDPDELVGEVLPDRGAAVVTCSGGAGDGLAAALADRLRALGYADVRTYREGVDDWVGAGLPLDRPRPIRTSLAELATN